MEVALSHQVLYHFVNGLTTLGGGVTHRLLLQSLAWSQSEHPPASSDVAHPESCSAGLQGTLCRLLSMIIHELYTAVLVN